MCVAQGAELAAEWASPSASVAGLGPFRVEMAKITK